MTAPVARPRPDRSPLVVDAVIALALTALSLVTLVAGARDVGAYDPLSIGLLLLQTLPLVARRVAPLPVFLVTAGATALHAVFAGDSLSTTLGSLIALFTLAERADRRVAVAGTVGFGAVLASLIAWRGGIPLALGSLVQTEVAVVVAYVLGRWSRERRAELGTAEERAERAEREREERARAAVAAERERIARELHDVVAHHVSVIVIQAGAGRRALDRRPADAATALGAIDGAARAALGELRRMLGILGAPGEAAEREPLPGLDRLGELLERVRAAGVRVELAFEGERRPLDPGVELAAFRIVQEALTNVLRHAPGARARVVLGFEPDVLTLLVTDDGAGTPVATGDGAALGAGRGLVGMRERVALFGGDLEAGPSPAGWQVRATLPLAGGADEADTVLGEDAEADPRHAAARA